MFNGFVDRVSFQHPLEIESREGCYPQASSETHYVLKEDQRLIKSRVNYFENLSEFIEDCWLNEIMSQEVEYLNTFCETVECFNLGPNLVDAFLSLKSLTQEIEEAWEEEYETLKKLTEIGLELTHFNELGLKGLVVEEIIAKVKGTKLGSELIQHYKDQVDYICLYALTDATEYWKAQGFKEFYPSYYLWTNNPALENAIFNA